MDNAQYAELFLTESREHVSAINHSLLELERSGGARGADAVGAIFRAVHTIKGVSATMGYTPVATLSHEMETLLDAMRRGARDVDPHIMELLFRSADMLERSIEGAVQGLGAPPELDAIVTALRDESTQTRRPRVSQAIAMPTIAGEWTAPSPAASGLLLRVRIVENTPLKGVR